MQLEEHPRYRVHDVREDQAGSPAATLAEEVLAGLTANRKNLPCRFIYDERGSLLFERICELDEYYPTRAEMEILTRHRDTIMGGAPSNVVIELGAGSARKVSHLIGSTIARHGSAHYLPIDVSRKALDLCGEGLVGAFENLTISALLGEYEPGLAEAARWTRGGRTILWLGGSIGNYRRAEAAAVLTTFASHLRSDDHIVVGIDLRKDRATLERAYDDSEGVTAEFNLNLLRRINDELGGEFELDRFAHVAHYDDEIGCVQMFIESRVDQTVRIRDLDLSVEFTEGERIHTEDSCKYSLPEIQALATAAGLHLESQWLDSERRFSLNAFTLEGDTPGLATDL